MRKKFAQCCTLTVENPLTSEKTPRKRQWSGVAQHVLGQIKIAQAGSFLAVPKILLMFFNTVCECDL